MRKMLVHAALIGAIFGPWSPGDDPAGPPGSDGANGMDGCRISWMLTWSCGGADAEPPDTGDDGSGFGSLLWHGPAWGDPPVGGLIAYEHHV